MSSHCELLSIYISDINTNDLPLGYYDRNNMTNYQLNDYEDSMVDFIARKFVINNIGTIDKINLHSQSAKMGDNYYIAFVYFQEWYEMYESKTLQKTILDETKDAVFKVSENKFWHCNKNEIPLY